MWWVYRAPPPGGRVWLAGGEGKGPGPASTGFPGTINRSHGPSASIPQGLQGPWRAAGEANEPWKAPRKCRQPGCSAGLHSLGGRTPSPWRHAWVREPPRREACSWPRPGAVTDAKRRTRVMKTGPSQPWALRREMDTHTEGAGGGGAPQQLSLTPGPWKCPLTPSHAAPSLAGREGEFLSTLCRCRLARTPGDPRLTGAVRGGRSQTLPRGRLSSPGNMSLPAAAVSKLEVDGALGERRVQGLHVEPEQVGLWPPLPPLPSASWADRCSCKVSQTL